MPVEVFLLGGWDLLRDGKPLFQGGKRAQKSLELLKFLMGHRGEKLSPESIVDSLWEDASLVDAQNTLRTQIFRLRRMLQEEGLYETGGTGAFLLSFERGYYVFSLAGNCSVDTDRFESCVRDAGKMQRDDPACAAAAYERAVGLYRGEYLPEDPDRTWTFPPRAHFRRLYIQSMLRLFELLRQRKRPAEIVERFEQAMRLEPLEESLNLCYLEALLELKEYGMALSYYRYLAGRMKRELCVGPSTAMKSLYIRITAGERNAEKAGLWDLSREFFGSGEPEGALYCELEPFRMICGLEERRSLRCGGVAFLGLATISNPGGNVPDRVEEAGKALKNILGNSLRKGDVFTRWNPYQMLLLLLDAGPDSLIPVGSRIRRMFRSSVGGSMTVELEFRPVRGIPSDFLKKACK